MLLLLGVATGCGSPAGGGEAAVVDVPWVLEAANGPGGEATIAIEGRGLPSLELSDDGSWEGDDGCNVYSGHHELLDGTANFELGLVSEIGCDEVGEVAALMYDVLDADGVEMVVDEDGRLHLRTADATLTYRPSRDRDA